MQLLWGLFLLVPLSWAHPHRPHRPHRHPHHPKPNPDVELLFKEYFEWLTERDPLGSYIAGVQFDDLRLSNYRWMSE